MAEDVASLTLSILREIRDEARSTNERLDKTNERLEALTTEVREGFAELRADVRALRGETGELGGQMEEAVRVLKNHDSQLQEHGHALRRLVEQNDGLALRFDHFLTGPHREDHDALRARVERIEQHLFGQKS